LANPVRRCHRLLVAGDVPTPLPPGLAAEQVGRAEIDSLLPRGAVHQGIALNASRLPRQDIEVLLDLPAGERAVAVMLDQVTDPQNVGAVLRSAAAFGAKAVIVQDRHAPEETGALAKAASGALEAVPLIRTGNLSRALDELKEAGWWAVGLAHDGDMRIEQVRDRERTILVLGAEGIGMRRLVREHCDLVAAIPMTASNVSSLNVSNAAAIALYVMSQPR
jgi:23S rRNA (guanosine2251-2'-O)-methyltransferase